MFFWTCSRNYRRVVINVGMGILIVIPLYLCSLRMMVALIPKHKNMLAMCQIASAANYQKNI